MFSDSENRFFWFKQNRKKIYIALSIFTLISIGCISYCSRAKFLSFRDHFDANVFFSSLSHSPKKKNIQILESLKKITSRHPELQEKFNAPLTQLLISQNEGKTALDLSRPVLERTGNRGTYHSRFAKTSLIMAEGKYSQALEEAKSLCSAMDKDNQFWVDQKKSSIGYGSLLYSLNLMRISALEKELGSKSGELGALKKLKEYCESKSSMNSLETLSILKDMFQEKEISLSDYIQYREKFLSE